MRKASGLFLALALLVSVGVTAAGPAGSAVKAPTCKTLHATGKFSPALPKLGSKVIVTAKVTSSGTIGGCTGAAGVTSATTSTAFTYKGNCDTFAGIKKGGVTTPGKEVIKWNKGAPSNVITTTKTTSAPGVQPSKIVLTTKFVSGQFAGATTVSHANGTSVKGACITTTLGGFTLVGTK